MFAHRLPDAVNKAGTGRALRVVRIARTAQQNLISRKSDQREEFKISPQAVYFVPVKQNERGEMSLSHA